MEYQLYNSHPRFIEIQVTGVVDKTGLVAAMSELLSHPDYHCKNTLWDFSQASMGLSMGDLGEIAGVLRLFKPGDKTFSSRSALLVPSMMELGMARIYISISRLLPFDYKAFTKRDKAMDFLTS